MAGAAPARRSRRWGGTCRARSAPAGRRRWAARRTARPRATRPGSARRRSTRCSRSWTSWRRVTRRPTPRASSPTSRARAAHERAGSADGVNLLTFHRAKGLEWDAVFLPSLEEGILPIRQAKDDEAAVAEERRLLYVGITRARESPRAVVGGAARDARPRGAPPAEPLPAGPAAAARHPDHARCPARRPGAPGPRPRRCATTRCSRRSAPGGRPGPATDAMPPYVIAHDATLAAIAEDRPRTLAAPAAGQGDGTGEAREVRRRDPGRDRGGAGDRGSGRALVDTTTPPAGPAASSARDDGRGTTAGR